MIDHFGIKLRKPEEELKLKRENYAKISDNKSSFVKNVINSESKCKKFYDEGMINFDINMKNFSSLNKKDFCDLLNQYIIEHNQFSEVKDLTHYSNKKGYYIIVLDEYCQVYIGQSNDIKKRIMEHWNRKMPLDRLIFGGGIEGSVLSIDSFRALDTTRIYAFLTDDNLQHEDRLIMEFPLEHRLNRVRGIV